MTSSPQLVRAAAAATVVGVLLSGCGGSGDPGSATKSGAGAATVQTSLLQPAPAASSAAQPAATVKAAAQRAASATVLRGVAHNINVPWGIAFLSNGKALVSSRDRARILRVNPATGKKKRIGTVPGVVSNGASGGEAGLLGLALSPKFSTNHWLYAYMSTSSDNRVVRMHYRHGKLGPVHVLLKGIPNGLHHNGGRIAFGPDHKLYVTTGEGGVGARAQHKKSLGGKILRMTAEGSPAGIRQPVQGRAAGLQLRPPQRRGSRVGLGRSAVGHGVRRQGLGRAEPDQGRSQLRLARDRGPHEQPRVHQSQGPVAHLQRRPLGHRDHQQRRVDRRGHRPPSAAGAAERDVGVVEEEVPRQCVRSVAHRCGRTRRHVVADHEQHRRAWQPQAT